MRWGTYGALAVLLLGVWGDAVAQDADLPSPTILSCGANCQKAAEPEAIGPHTSHYPGISPENYPTEGLVAVRFTVTKEGLVKDPLVIRLIGPKSFADAVLEDCPNWRYKPATRNGVAVDRPNWMALLFFRFPTPAVGARSEIFRAFKRAQDESGAGHYTDAIAILLAALETPHLNFYERQALSLELAIDYMRTGDFLSAREYSNDSTFVHAYFLSKNLRPIAFRVAIEANAAIGQYAEVLDAFEELNKLSSVAEDDPIRKVVADATASLQNPKPLAVTARIPKLGFLPLWRHKLMRRDIAIPVSEGKLDRVMIDCDQQTLESAFSSKAEWHIPKGWTNCSLSVTGDPGATFTLLEAVE